MKPKGSESAVIDVKKENEECASRDITNKIQERGLEKNGDIIHEKNGKEAFEKRSPEFATAFQGISDEASDVKTIGNELETAKVEPEAAGNGSEKGTVGNNAKKFVRVVKSRLILPIRLQQQTRRGKRKESESSHGREGRCGDKESTVEENIEEKTATGTNEEENFETSANVTPLSAGKLQQLIREKVLSQSQTNSKRTNQKTMMLSDYLRTLQKHMGITESVAESNSPDFSETPFMAVGKNEDEQSQRIPTTMQRRLEMLQQQIVRLPTNFTLLDGDLVED